MSTFDAHLESQFLSEEKSLAYEKLKYEIKKQEEKEKLKQKYRELMGKKDDSAEESDIVKHATTSV